MEKDLNTSFEIVPQQQASASNNIPSVYVPEYDITVKTDIDDPFLIRYLAGRKGRNIPRENFFGMEDMKSSQGELANGIISQAARGMAGTAASFAMTTYRAAKGFGGSLMDIAKRDWQLKELEDKKTNDTAYLQEQKAKGKLTEEEYKKRLAELETQYISLASTIHKKFLEADEAANREMERLKKANEEWLKRAGLAKTGRDGFVYDLAAGTMSLAFAVGATMAFKSPAAGGALFGLITGREDYEEAIENGKSRETAAYLGLAGGSASWFLESLGVDNIFRALKNAGLLKHFAKGAIGEFAEEFGQNIADDAIMIKYGGRKKTTRQIVEDAIAAGVIGGITGGFFGGTIGYYNDYQQTKAELSQLAQNIKFKQAEETLQKISETEPTKLPYVDDKGNIIDENGNIAGKAEPEEAPETKAQAKRDVDPGYLNWVYQDTVSKLMENGLDREAAENLAGRAMGKAADIVITVIPQMIDHELNEATLEGQADEIAAQLRETIQNLGKKRPLKKAFRQEIEQIYNKELEKGKAQGLKAEEAEFYAKMHATRIMWESAYTGLSPRFIAEQAAIELRNERAEAAQQRELPGTYIHKEEDGTYSLKGRYYAGSYYKSGRIKENRGWEDVEETGTIFEGFKTEEEARAFASRLAEMQEDLPGSGGAKAERAGLPRRPKNSQAGKGLLKMLGFKDVKTGRELTKGEEKALASAAYDGIYDLAEILNIPPESLALNGTLTIKLGAPKTDIKPGEGAKYRAKDKTIIMDSEAGSGRFAAAWYAAFTDYMKSPDIRPEMKAAFNELRKAINSRKLTAEEIQREQEKSLKEAEKGLKEANDAIDNSEVSFELYELVDEINSSNRYIEAYPIEEENLFDGKPQERQAGVDNRIIDEAYQAAGEQGARLISDLIAAHNNIIAVESMDFSTDLSRFAADYSAATGKTTADSKERAASETELEAAAFASYIYNRLLEKGGKNTFLARPDKGRTFDVRRALREDAEISPYAEPGEAGDPFAYPYPVGRERQDIFNAFDKVFSTLKYETTESGKVRLYQPPYNETGSFGKTIKEFFGISGTTNAKIYSDIQRIIHNPTLSNKTLISLGYVPDIYVALNLVQDKKLNADRATFRKAYGILTKAELKRNLHNHKVPDKVIRNIGNLIADPLMIFESQQIPGRIIALLTDCIFDAKHKFISHPVIAVLSPSSNGKGYTLIPSVHDRNTVIKMISDADSKNQIYYIKNKKAALNRIAYGKNTQPPSVWTGLSYQSMLPNNSIPSKEDIVKRYGLTGNNRTTFYQSAKNSLPETIEVDGEQKPTTNSEGRPIAATEEGVRNFYKWFGNSKVVDNDGRPLVMYHGTPNKGFEEFNTPSHFSPDKKYAEGYQAPNASAMGFKQNSDNPGTYSVYLSIKHPFDARNDEAREIFLNEYRAYYSPELTDRGMVDWMEAEDLIEWLKENHPEYDGLIVDEGGTGGYGEAVKSRGDSYLPFEPNQIKSVDNTGKFDPKNPNIYYQPTETQKGIAESEKYRGKTEWFRDSARTIITLFRSADASTLPHELAHVFMLDLQRMAKLNPDGRLGQILKDLKETVGEPQGEVAGEYSVEQQEKFARLFERYIAEGYAPDKGWRRLFAIFKDWLRSIYRTFKDFPELSPAAKDLFDRWLSFDDVSNIPGMETLKDYRGRINALKAVAEAAKDNRDIEEDGITAQDLKAVLNVTRMDRPEDTEAQKAYNEALAIADEITESQAEANGLLEKIEDMEHRGARQFDSRDVAMFDRAIERIEAIQAGKDTESGGTSFYQSGKEHIDYSKDGKYYENFLDIHKEYADNDPGQWEGQTIEEAKRKLNFDENKGYAGIQSPIEEVKITDGGFTHLFKENNKERKKDLLRAKATIESPDLILEENVADKNGKTKPYHYYVKIFNRDGETKGHWQVVKVMPDGSWYSTNYPLRKGKFEAKIKNSTVIYDRAVQRAESLPKKGNQNGVYPSNDSTLPSNNSITENSEKNNPNNGQTFFQSGKEDANKFILPEALGRANERIEPVAIKRHFADRKESREIELDEVISILDKKLNVKKGDIRKISNDNGETVILSKNSIDEMFNHTRIRDGLNIGGILGKEAIANLPEIFKTAVPIAITGDLKRESSTKFIRYGNVFESDGEIFLIKITVKEFANNRKLLTDVEIERNKGRDLAAYDIKVARRDIIQGKIKEAAAGNTSTDKSLALRNGSDYIISDLIDFIKFDLEKYLNKNASGGQTLYQSAKAEDLGTDDKGNRQFLLNGVVFKNTPRHDISASEMGNYSAWGRSPRAGKAYADGLVDEYSVDYEIERLFPNTSAEQRKYIKQLAYSEYHHSDISEREDKKLKFYDLTGRRFFDSEGNFINPIDYANRKIEEAKAEKQREQERQKKLQELHEKNTPDYVAVPSENLIKEFTGDYEINGKVVKGLLFKRCREPYADYFNVYKDGKLIKRRVGIWREAYNGITNLKFPEKYARIAETIIENEKHNQEETKKRLTEIYSENKDVADFVRQLKLKGYETSKSGNLYVSGEKPLSNDVKEGTRRLAQTIYGHILQEFSDGSWNDIAEVESYPLNYHLEDILTEKKKRNNGTTFYQSAKEPDRFRREDYAWAFRKTGDNRYAVSKINSVIGSLMKELQKRKIDPETKERITRTLRSAIGYKGYLTRVRQARSLVDEAIRNASGLENTFTEMRPKPVLTEEKDAELIQFHSDPKNKEKVLRKAGVQTWWEELKEKYFTDPLTKVARSVSDRAEKISPRLKLAFREFARNFNMQRTAHVKAIEPFLKAYHAMEEDDKRRFDYAAFNGDTDTIEKLKKKYENLAPALETYRNVLNEIYVQAAEAGFEVGYIQDYFPRKVKYPVELINHIKGTDEWTFIERWLKQQLKVNDPDGWINAKEHQEVIADMISRQLHTTGFAGQGGTGKPGNIKKRRIFEVTPEMMSFYYDSAEAAVMYAAEMDRAIQARKFFGYDIQHEEESINMVIADIIEDRKAAKAKDPSVKLLTAKEERELFRDIQSVMHPIGPGNIGRSIKTWGYMFTLVDYASTLTQLEDLSVSFVENGIGRTLASVTGKKITLEDIGVEIYDPEINSLTGMSKYLNTALKATGFSKMDRFGKETFILSDFKKRVKQVKTDRQGFIEECEMYGYEPERIKNMVECFMKGDINDLNDDAKSLLFYDLAEVQPIDMAEMPEMYLRGGNWRIAYALKTFTLKRLNYLIEKSRRLALQGKNLWDKGDKAAAMEAWLKGIGTMTWTMFLLVSAGASLDWLKDLIFGRQTDIPSVVVDNMLKQASFNRWEIKRVIQDPADMMIAKIYPPLITMGQDLWTDLIRVWKGNLEMKDIRLWNNIPIVGRLYYWRFGGGKLLTEKQKEKEARKKRAKKRRQKQRRHE